MEIAARSIEQLETDALTAPRQLSICYTQMAAAKRALQLGDKAAAATHLEASKRAWLRSQEDTHGQLRRVAATDAVVAERGAKADALQPGGKHVARVAMGRKGATWLESWGTR